MSEPSAPGRDGAITTQPSNPQAVTGAPAPSGSSSMMSSLPMMLVMALPLLLVVFTSRSQAKKQKKLEESLKVGDRIVTRAGLIGKLLELGDRTARVELAPGVVATMLKTAIEGVDAAPSVVAGSDKVQEKKA